MLFRSCYTHLWIIWESLSVHGTLLEIGRLDGTSRISKVGMFEEDNETHDTSEHQSGSNTNTQGDGWLDFFYSKVVTIKFSFTLLFSLFCDLCLQMVAIATRKNKLLKPSMK